MNSPKLFNKITNVYGPPGCGKTKYMSILMQLLSCNECIDEVEAISAKMTIRPSTNLLILSQQPVHIFAGQAVEHVLHINTVLPFRPEGHPA